MHHAVPSSGRMRLPTLGALTDVAFLIIAGRDSGIVTGAIFRADAGG
jgi:hypothetical protein